jgi:hypothetical protein
MRDDIVFTTLCICGEDIDQNRTHFFGKLHYYKVCNILAHSIISKTKSSLVIVTDKPHLFVNHDRIKLINIYDLTNDELIKSGYMDFHLKRFALEQAFLMNKKYTVYMDCDVFIENFNYDVFDYLDSIQFDVMGKYMISNVQGRAKDPFIQEKIKEFGILWSDKFKSSPLPQEILILFKQNDEYKQKKFIEFWNILARHYKSVSVPTCFDSIFFGASIIESDMIFLDVTHNNLTGIEKEKINQFVYGFRLIHADFVNSMDNVHIEKYDYETLLQRVS